MAKDKVIKGLESMNQDIKVLNKKSEEETVQLQDQPIPEQSKVEPVEEPVKAQSEPKKVDPIKALKKKIKQNQKEEGFKQVTFYLSQENIDFIADHWKKKGQKSDFINELLTAFFKG